VLVTSRRPLAALADGVGYPVLLGPLPAQEAALYVGQHPALSRMVFGGDGGENHEQQQLRQLKAMLPLLPMLPEEMRRQVEPLLNPEFRARLDALPPGSSGIRCRTSTPSAVAWATSS
jgi:hypothetical protein